MVSDLFVNMAFFVCVWTKRHGEAIFSYYAPSLWKSLPESLRRAETVDMVFKRDPKTHLF
jgi:hypothetical protein